jgi:hypothetical protein
MKKLLSAGIILAVYRPNPKFLSDQVQSLVDQSYPYERIIVGVDELVLTEEIKLILEELPNMTLIKHKNIGSVRNFETLLTFMHEKHDMNLIFFSDQDDIWETNKIEKHVSIAETISGDHFLLHSDLSSINAENTQIHSSVFETEGRGVEGFPIFNSVFRNNVTGCAASISNELALLSLPFPTELQELGVHHDAWVNALAGAIGDVKYINNALVQYRQHQDNQIGVSVNGFRYKSLGSKLGSYRIRRKLTKLVINRINSRGLTLRNKEYTKFDKSPVYFLFCNIGKNLGSKNFSLYIDFLIGSIISKAFVLKDLVQNLLKDSKSVFLNFRLIFIKLKELIKSDRLKSSIQKLVNTPSKTENQVVERVKIPGYLVPNDSASIILLVPHLPPTPIYGGIATALELAFSLARISEKQLILISVNQRIQNEHDTRLEIESRFGNDVDILLKDFTCNILFGEDDLFIMTAWWTAEYVLMLEEQSKMALKKIYLIQDYEPNFYPWSTNYARALATYGSNCKRIFNTSLLKEFFLKLDLAKSEDLSIKPVVTSAPKSLERKQEKCIEVVFYYRPSVSRNMSALTIEALTYFLNYRVSKIPIRLSSIGEKVSGLVICDLPVQSYGHLAPNDYVNLLKTKDLGLSLMLSPHPSYPPLDMAASGIRTVTNSFANKVAGSIPLLNIANPDYESLGRALIQAENDLYTGINSDLDDSRIISDALGCYTVLEAARVASEWT